MSPTSEQELLDAVVDLAMLNRWAVCHFRPAKTQRGWRTAIQGHIGFPDLVIARKGVVLFRELKGYNARGRLGQLSSEQRDWANQLGGFGVVSRAGETPAAARVRALPIFDLWIPDDLDTVIVPTLTGRASA